MTPINEKNRVRLFRFAADAWEGGVREWCRESSELALEGTLSWFVAAGPGHARWVKRRALEEGMTLFGIRFMAPGLLRFALCDLLGVRAVTAGRETLEFLLKLEALGRSDAESLAQARGPGACLEAMTRLGAAGWREETRKPPFPREALRRLEESGAWGPALDEELYFQSGMAAGFRLRTCFVGWDAAQWENIRLLDAAARASASCEFYQPMPHASGEALQQEWIKAVEKRLETGYKPCDASGFSSLNEALVSRLEGADLDEPAPVAPRFLVGHDWRDEMGLVRDYVVEQVAAMADGGRLGIVTPGKRPSSLEIVRMLTEAGLSIFDETGENQAKDRDLLVQRQMARYHLLGCDVEALLGLIDLLNDLKAGSWQWLSRERVRYLFRRAFAETQTRNARLLVHAFGDTEGETKRRLRELVDALGSWQGTMSWDEAREKWEGCLRGFGLGVEKLEPAWSAVPGGGLRAPGTAFLEYFEQILAAGNTKRAEGADSPYAPVVVTTMAQARGQEWDGLLFLDSNEGVWPVRPEENAFLDDATCHALNLRRGGRGRLLETGDRSAIEQSHFLELLENCRGEVAFAAIARDEGGSGSREAYPNEWMIRALAESGTGAGVAIMDAWRGAVVKCERKQRRLPEKEREAFAAVHARRRDPEAPFDEYFFNYHGSSFVAGDWSPSDLDKALNTPATFALKTILNAETDANDDFVRGEKHALGLLVHRWLREALGGTCEFAPFRFSPGTMEALTRVVAATQADLEKCFAREEMPLPLWWRSALRKAAWIGWRCLAPLADDHGFFVMEYPLAREIGTTDGKLRLNGRIDLLQADRAGIEGGAVRIVDFKTGRSKPPTLASLDKGNGFQFAAYYLMAKEAGAAEVSAGVIRPAARKFEKVFGGGDESELRRMMAALALRQLDLDFGQAGPMVARWGPCEALPMATSWISPRTLERKAALRNPGSA